MSEPLKPVGYISEEYSRGSMGAGCLTKEREPYYKVPVYTESQLEAARAEGRLLGLEEAAKCIDDEYDGRDTFSAQAIRALADKDK